MIGSARQVDTEYKVRWKRLGGHVHCILFGRKRGSSTWQSSGSFVVGEENWLSLQISMTRMYFEDSDAAVTDTSHLDALKQMAESDGEALDKVDW